MPVRIDKLPDAPILVVHSIQGDDPVKELTDSVAEISRMLDALPEPVFLINDVTNISMDLNDIIQAASATARGADAILHHRNVRENLFVLTDKFIIMAIQGLNSATFGQIKAHVFPTVEEAVAYCRGRLGAGGS